jgi:DNA-binding response OmpR family regulator
MQRNAERLLRLINQLLDFSRLESGKMKLQASKSDIVSFVKGLLMSFQTYAEQKKIKYRFTTGHDKIDLYFDRDKMEKVIVNLLSNAFKFTPEHGGISVQIRQVENSVFIKIKDSGVGIEGDKIEHIFDRFYQVDGSLTRDQEGTGIGLALTKELIELHQGKISVESVVGRGTKFAVMLPCGKDHLNADEIVAEDLMLTEDAKHQVAIDDVQASDSFMDNKSSKTIILVVEDNPDMHAYIRDTLHPDYQVKEAHDGEEGVKLAKDIIPDLIISDLMMPKKDGYQLCSELKQDDRTSHIPVILLTAKAKHEDKLMGLQLGADDYLVKPFDSKELQIRIKNLIEIRRNLQAAFRNGNGQLNNADDNKELINPVDQLFMERVTEIVKVNMVDEQFDIKQFSKEIGMSGTQLRRKMNALTGLSPNQFLRSFRLKEAGRLIREEQHGVSEAAYKVGFNSLSYFSKCFQEQFGILPSDY